MKTRRLKAVVAVTAAGVLALSACTSGGGDPATTPPAEPTTEATTPDTEPTQAEETEDATEDVTEETTEATEPTENLATCLQDLGITEPQEGEVKFSTGEQDWSGYNSITADTYSTYNNVIASQMSAGFVYYGTDGTICRDETFGTFEALSGIGTDEPLVVEYTISDDATWSDGTPITINDYLMDWVTQNPEFLVPGYANGENEDAEAVFNHVSASFAQYVPEGPQGEAGSKTFTIEYNEKNPDWQLMVGSALPAHVVADQLGLEPDAWAQAILDRDVDTITQAADFWNTGWLSEPGELPDPAIAPSAGPYRLMADGWIAGQSLTLEANPDYFGTPPATQLLTFRFLSPGTHVQSLANEELNVIEPQATVDTLTQLENLGDSVTIDTNSGLTWEHLDYRFAEEDTLDDGTVVPASPFAESQGGLAAREAFAYCAPRQQIVDTLIKPIAPDTELMNARESFPFQENYAEVVEAAYDGRYDEVNLDLAREKFAEAGFEEGQVIRLGYNGPNERRSEQVALIKASCDQVGFVIEDVSSNEFFTKTLPSGAYDVALFAWAGSGQIASGQNIYSTGRPQNYGQYSNPEVDAAFNTLAGSLEPEVHLEQVKIIEKHLWDDLYGLPIFAHPGVVAYTTGLENVRNTVTQSGVSWNAFQWAFAE